ncbi:MAG: (2Fe-2S)-binding protein [Cyclobacteriaceae bacterium]|jgi:ferredoxin|nr:(2Fe-2S)-binding protein [Cyclobacteriaceae bacterium]
MPHIRYQGEILECSPGANLREVILKNELNIHNRFSRILNCRGMGTCGTCAVKITGNVSPPSTREKLRLNFPPHKIEYGLRLACQVQVFDDIEIHKYEGFWGEKVIDRKINY